MGDNFLFVSFLLTTGKCSCVLLHIYILAHFEFVIIEQLCNLNVNNNSVDDRLLTREAFWCAQLCTMKPHGLNKRCEFNSRNRIRYN